MSCEINFQARIVAFPTRKIMKKNSAVFLKALNNADKVLNKSKSPKHMDVQINEFGQAMFRLSPNGIFKSILNYNFGIAEPLVSSTKDVPPRVLESVEESKKFILIEYNKLSAKLNSVLKEEGIDLSIKNKLLLDARKLFGKLRNPFA